MRIVYGAFGQGNGHFSKAAVIIPLLEARGHEVCVVSSGRPEPPAGYSFPRHHHFPGLAYRVRGDRTDFPGTLRQWLRETPQVFANLLKLRRIIRQFQPDLILSDFEPLTASPLIGAECEVVSLCRQTALSDRAIPLPDETGLQRKITRSVIHLFTGGADRVYGYHYEPVSERCVPPIVRPDLFDLAPERGKHLLIYNGLHAGGVRAGEELVAWANRRGVPVRVYGMPQIPRGRQGLVEFKPPSRNGMLHDVRTARGVLTSAGFTTAVEAFLLHKPVCVVPIPGHWEQQVNAFHLERAGIAAASTTWDCDRLLEVSPPAGDHPLRRWLGTRPEQIVDWLLGVETPRPAEAVEPWSPRRAAA